MAAGFANVRAGLALTAGTGIVGQGTIVLSNANGISFGASLSASSLVITASAATTTGGIRSISAGTTRITSGTAVLSSTPALTFGLAGQTVTGGRLRVTCWDNQRNNSTQNSVGTNSSAPNLEFGRQIFPYFLNATQLYVYGRISQSNSEAGTISVSFGIYSLTGSTATLLSTASRAITWIAGAATDDPRVYGYYSGQAVAGRALSIPCSWNLTPGDYLIGIGNSVQVNGVSTASLSYIGDRRLALFTSPVVNSAIVPVGGVTMSDWLTWARFSTGSSVMPNSLHVTDLVQTVIGVTGALYQLTIVGS